MKFITSLSVQRTHPDPSPFWPAGIQRLVVLVWQPGPHHDLLVALGVVPGRGGTRDHGRIVFHVELAREQLGAFIKVVIDGPHREIERHCHKSGTHKELAAFHAALVAIKASLALATSLSADEALAESVVNPGPALHPAPRDPCERKPS